MGRVTPRMTTPGRLLVLALALLLGGGCSNKQKKLSGGGDILGQVYYDLLGGQRAPSHYFGVLQGSRDPESFAYRMGDDPYLVDKNIDAITRLGGAEYGRLEGLANTVALMLEVLLEDASALARSQAACSLARLGARLPRYAARGPLDDGTRLAAALAEVSGLLAEGAAGRARLAGAVAVIGSFQYEPGVYAKKALQFFGTTPGLVDERDPEVRTAIDTAVVKVMRQAIVYGLTAAIEGPADFVRADALRGLRVLREPGSVEAVRTRLPLEVSPTVRGEAADYLGSVASPASVEALVALLQDVDGSVRWKARQGLTRVAGEDLGHRAGPWQRWARERWPGVAFPEDAAAAVPAG